MARTILWLAAGVALGLVIHLAVILTLPNLSSNGLWPRAVALNALNKVKVLPAVEAGAHNLFRLDPDLSYAVCQLDLHAGPGVVSGTLPQAFWTVAVYDRSGTVIYSTTNRGAVGLNLDLGLFDSAQTRLLAEQQLNVAPGLLIVESSSDDVFVVVRLAPEQPAMRKRYEEILAGLACGSITS